MRLTEQEKQIIKNQAINLVDSGDSFVIEEGFDDIVQYWDKANPQDEGKFIDGEMISTFAGLIVPFLIGLAGDTVKDVVKDQAKKSVEKLVEKRLKKTTDAKDIDSLKATIEKAVNESKFKSEDKIILLEGFEKVYEEIST